MKIGDKVKVLLSPYSIFDEGKVYTIGYVDDRPYGVYLVDPFYETSGEAKDCRSWAFHREELELVKQA